MKKFLTLSFLTFITIFSDAQIINPGFENWTMDTIASPAKQPNNGNDSYGWWSYNYFNSPLVGSSPVSVIQSTDTIHSGDYAVRLESVIYTSTSWNIYKNVGYPFIGHEYNDTLGILFTGKIDVTTQEYIPGFECNKKLSQLSFYYQYKPNGIDTAECRVLLLNNGTEIAGGRVRIDSATGDKGWQKAVVDFTYVNDLTPDTLYVLFSSTSLDGSPKTGSVLWLDDVETEAISGIVNPLNTTIPISIYPNPMNNSSTIFFKNPLNRKYNLTILDFSGKTVYSLKNIVDNKFTITKKDLKSGIYIVRLQDEKENIFSKKLIIQ